MTAQLRIGAAWLALLLGGGVAEAQVGERIVVGVSVPLTGPQAAQGRAMAQGLEAAFAQVNEAGGIEGRRIEIEQRDDGGVPERSAANTRQLVDAGVLALTGYIGERGVEASMPFVEAAGVPMVGVASGAESLREPARRLVFPLRAGLTDEVWAVMTQLDSQGMTRLALIVQDDVVGRGVREAFEMEMYRMAMRPSAVETVPASSPTAAMKALQVVCVQRSEAVLLLLDVAAIQRLWTGMREAGCSTRPQVVVTSDIAAQLLASPAEAKAWAGLIVVQVMPQPSDRLNPLVIAYRKALARWPDAQPSAAGIEGYFYGRVIADALKACGRRASRACVAEMLDARTFDINGVRVRHASPKRRGLRFAELTIVNEQGALKR